MNNEWCGFAYMNMNKDMQMELQKPTNSSKFGKWIRVQIWIVANQGITHVDSRTTYLYPANTGLDPHEFLTAETINHLGTQKEIGEGLKVALSTGRLQLQLEAQRGLNLQVPSEEIKKLDMQEYLVKRYQTYIGLPKSLTACLNRQSY